MSNRMWTRLENNGAIVIGVGITIIGLLFIFVASYYTALNSTLVGIFSNLGVGLIAAGIVTATLEPISRRRHQNDVNEVKNSHFDAILRGVMPQQIYDEIQAHVIRQPFIRNNVRMIFELEWADEDKNFIIKKQSAIYEVINMSKTIENYDVRVLEEREYALPIPDLPKIDGLQIQLNEHENIQFSEHELADMQISTEQHVEICHSVSLEPGNRIEVVVSTQSALGNRVHSVIMLIPTINLELTISHPDDMVVRNFPLHPSDSNFFTDSDTDKLKRWRLEGGILPYQGFEISWCPREIPQ